jgi:hypothetical protein
MSARHRIHLALRDLLLAGLMLVATAQAHAQSTETEPNDTCATAQAVSGNSVHGSLVVGDVDFFNFSLAPGHYFFTVNAAGVEDGSLQHALVGFFNDCGRRLQFGFDRQQIVVRESGIAGVAVASAPNYLFRPGIGDGSGTYLLAATPAVRVTLKAITLDGFTREPVPYVQAYVQRCLNADCSERTPVSYTYSDAQGIVRFREYALIGDRFRIMAFPSSDSGYEGALSQVVEVTADGDVLHAGGLRLLQRPLRLSDISGDCGGPPTPGAVCDITVTVRNLRSTKQALHLWGIATMAGPRVHPSFQFGGVAGRPAPVVAVIPAKGHSDLHLLLKIPPRAPQAPFRVVIAGSPPNDILYSYFNFSFQVTGTPSAKGLGTKLTFTEVATDPAP